MVRKDDKGERLSIAMGELRARVERRKIAW